MTDKFIKVVNPEIAEKLVVLGFQYIKEGAAFAFPYSDDLILVLQREYTKDPYVIENKLRF